MAVAVQQTEQQVHQAVQVAVAHKLMGQAQEHQAKVLLVVLVLILRLITVRAVVAVHLR